MKLEFQSITIRIPGSGDNQKERDVMLEVPVRWDELIEGWVLTEEAHEMMDHRRSLEMAG
jgi:FtsZ-interacting cell division protein ZipA